MGAMELNLKTNKTLKINNTKKRINVQNEINKLGKVLDGIEIPHILLAMDKGRMHLHTKGNAILKLGMIALVKELELKKIKGV